MGFRGDFRSYVTNKIVFADAEGFRPQGIESIDLYDLDRLVETAESSRMPEHEDEVYILHMSRSEVGGTETQEHFVKPGCLRTLLETTLHAPSSELGEGFYHVDELVLPSGWNVRGTYANGLHRVYFHPTSSHWRRDGAMHERHIVQVETGLRLSRGPFRKSYLVQGFALAYDILQPAE